MGILVSGLVNVETTVRVRRFPIDYYPIDYPFFGVESHVSGVGYNLAKALTALGERPRLLSYLGRDEEGARIERRLRADGIQARLLPELEQTPVSAVLYDGEGRRQIYCDLKDVQDRALSPDVLEQELEQADLVAACNISFNRPLVRRARELGKVIAIDVHVLSDLHDGYNRDFLEGADLLFLSDEGLPCPPERFLEQLGNCYPFALGVIGLGAKGAMLRDRRQGETYYLPAARAERVVNTVGAGDALFAAFLHYYAQGLEPVPALERAQIFAARKIAFNGASVGFPGAEEVEEAWRASERRTARL